MKMDCREGMEVTLRPLHKRISGWIRRPALVTGNLKRQTLTLVLLLFCAQWLGTGVVKAGTDQFGAMVQLTTFDGTSEKVGSGFVVAIEGDAAYVVTARHVVDGPADRLDISAVFYTDMMRTKQLVRVVDTDYQNDLALLRIRFVPAGTTTLSFATEVPSSGAGVELLGYPNGSRMPIPTYGQVSIARGARVYVDVSASEGNSGGPLLFQGLVAGVAVRVGEAGHSTEVVPSTIVSLLLDGALVQAVRRHDFSNQNSAAGRTTQTNIHVEGGSCRVIYSGGAKRTMNGRPSSKSPHAGTVQEGSPIQVIRRHAAEGRSWFQIRTTEGLVGWLAADQTEGCK